MSRDGRKPWETPIIYNDDRWTQPTPKPPAPPTSGPSSRGATDNGDERDERDIEEILNRPEREPNEGRFQSKDTEPLDYSRGPHDEEFGVDDNAFDAADTAPINYDAGPHEEEFGIDDDEELEPVDGTPEFDEF